MKVVILCGGRGTRLREHTETKPKPMIQIGRHPILWHLMRGYAHHGCKEFVLCLGYLGNVIREYFLNHRAMNSDFTVELGAKPAVTYHEEGGGVEDGWKVTLANTGNESMTGARIKRVARYLNAGEPFAVTYGDGLADIDVASLLEFHKAHGGAATVTGVSHPGRFGELGVAGTRVQSFSEKPETGGGLINGGFFIFEPRFLDYLEDDAGCILERAPLMKCAADGELHVYKHSGYWQCMDTYRDWEGLEKLWNSGAAPWKLWP